MSRKQNLVSTLAVAGVALFGAQAVQAQVVKVDGSSTVYPITEAVAEEFQKAKKNASQGDRRHFRYRWRLQEVLPRRDRFRQRLASDPGRRKWRLQGRRRRVHRNAGCLDALTVVINPKNAFLKQATVDELKMLWEPAAQGKITKWNQVNPAWPDAPIKLFGAGADSGTFDYFTEAIVGKAKSSRGDYTASEDDNVLVQGVSRDVNASATSATPTTPRTWPV
jgi:phosphate transport system substrate-binding protein